MNVYCIHCEAACSDQAVVCPKCGHPLFDPEAVERMVHGVSRRARLWIAAANVAVMVIAGVVYLAAGRRLPGADPHPNREDPAPIAPQALSAPNEDSWRNTQLNPDAWSSDRLAKSWSAARGWLWVLRPDRDDPDLVFAVANNPRYECLVFSAGFHRDALISAGAVLDFDGARPRLEVCLGQAVVMMATTLALDENRLQGAVNRACESVRAGAPELVDESAFPPYVLIAARRLDFIVVTLVEKRTMGVVSNMGRPEP